MVDDSTTPGRGDDISRSACRNEFDLRLEVFAHAGPSSRRNPRSWDTAARQSTGHSTTPSSHRQASQWRSRSASSRLEAGPSHSSVNSDRLRPTIAGPSRDEEWLTVLPRPDHRRLVGVPRRFNLRLVIPLILAAISATGPRGLDLRAKCLAGNSAGINGNCGPKNCGVAILKILFRFAIRNVEEIRHCHLRLQDLPLGQNGRLANVDLRWFSPNVVTSATFLEETNHESVSLGSVNGIRSVRFQREVGSAVRDQLEPLDRTWRASAGHFLR